MIIEATNMCCARFADFLCSRRERGMAIVPIVSKFPLSFLLCFRGLSAEDSGHIVGTGSVKVQTAFMVGIRHCPWCGADLRRFYSPRVDKLPVITVGDDAIIDPDLVFALVDKSEEVMLATGPPVKFTIVSPKSEPEQ